MKSLFEEMGGTYRQEGDYLIPNLALPDEPDYQIGKYGRMRRSYLKEHRPVLYANLLKRVVSRFMRKFDSGIWQKSITGGLRRPLGYVWAVGAQRVKGGGSRLSCP